MQQAQRQKLLFHLLQLKAVMQSPHDTPTGDDLEATGSVVESSVSRKCESMEVAHEVNKLWHADLKLCEQWLKVAQKQLAGQECLIGVVEMLTDALVHSGLVGGSLHGKVGVSGSMGKGKGKGRADVEVSLEMSDEDVDGEKDGSKDGEEEDD